MKRSIKIILSICFIISIFSCKKDEKESLIAPKIPHMFVHTITDENYTRGATYLDHPLLNGKPEAKMIVTHHRQPLGEGSTSFNNIRAGVYYNESKSRWTIYSENSQPMPIGASFNVYVGIGNEVRVATLSANFAFKEVQFDYPNEHRDPTSKLAVQTYLNPNRVHNNNSYGVRFNTQYNIWWMFQQNEEFMPNSASFFGLIDGIGVQTAQHQVLTDNLSGNKTTLDHPLLNNNPNAIIIASHVFGIKGPASEVKLNKVIGVQYSYIQSRWFIFLQDQTNMPLGCVFNLFIYDENS